MKKIFTSVGLAALGASTLHAQYAPGPAVANARGWSVGLSVREFYDDNYLTLPNSSARSTFGEEVSPTVSLNSKFNNSAFNASYVYDLQHYESSDIVDSSHQFTAGLKQQFSDRYSLLVNDAFTISQQPSVNSSGIINTPLYTSGDNVGNDGLITFTDGLTPDLDLQLTYENQLYAYQQTFGDVYNPNPTALNVSRSALLDRDDNLATVNLNWKLQNHLTAVLGYTYEHTGYTSPEPIIFDIPANGIESYGNPNNILSQSRNNDSHFFFVGADKQLMSQLTGRIRVGGEYVDYYNAMKDERGGLPATLSKDGVHPLPAGYAIMAPLAEAGILKALQ